jgi:ATP adenylyltransferase/5',5'''-P-1,P-4-tetraphosphate phosphorylase II
VKETDIVVHFILAALEKILRSTISKSATHLSPMTGVKTACDQDEVEHVREILGKNKKKRKSPNIQIP